MKKLILFISLLFVGSTLCAQNVFRHTLRAQGGIEVGLSTGVVKVDSIVQSGSNLHLYVGGSIYATFDGDYLSLTNQPSINDTIATYISTEGVDLSTILNVTDTIQLYFDTQVSLQDSILLYETGGATFDSTYIHYRVDSLSTEVSAITAGEIQLSDSTTVFVTPTQMFQRKYNHTWLYFADSASTITVTEDTWAQITNASDSLFRVRDIYGGITISGDTIILDPYDWDHYNVNASVAISPAAANNRLQVRLATVNGEGTVTELSKAYLPPAAATDTLTASLYGYWMPSTGGNKMIMQVMNTANSNDPTVIGGNWMAQWYHYETFLGYPVPLSRELGTYNDSIIVVAFDPVLETDSIPLATAFTFNVGTLETVVGLDTAYVNVGGDSLFIRMDSTLVAAYTDSTLLLSYAVPDSAKLQSPDGALVAAWTDQVVTNNLVAEEDPSHTFQVTSIGDGTGVTMLRFTVSEDITVTLSGTARFYTDAAGTEGESSTWSVTTGYRTIYLRCPLVESAAQTADMVISNGLAMTTFGQTYETGWEGGSNAMTMSGSIEGLNNLTVIRNEGYNSWSGSIEGLTDLIYLQVMDNNTLSGSLAGLTDLTRLWMTGNNTITYGAHTRAANQIFFVIQPASGSGWSVADLSQALIDNAATTWTSSKLYTTSTNHSSMANTTQGGIWGDFSGTAAPSDLAIALKELAVTKVVTVTLNGITQPGGSGDGTGFPAGFGDWWRSE